MRYLLSVIELAIFIGVAMFFLTQILIPLLANEPFFPLFRKAVRTAEKAEVKEQEESKGRDERLRQSLETAEAEAARDLTTALSEEKRAEMRKRVDHIRARIKEIDKGGK